MWIEAGPVGGGFIQVGWNVFLPETHHVFGNVEKEFVIHDAPQGRVARNLAAFGNAVGAVAIVLWCVFCRVGCEQVTVCLGGEGESRAVIFRCDGLVAFDRGGLRLAYGALWQRKVGDDIIAGNGKTCLVDKLLTRKRRRWKS